MIIVSVLLYIIKVSPFDIKRDVAICLTIRCITGFLGFATEFFAVKFTELSKIVIILYNPFLTSFMSFLIIGERVNKQDLLSFLLGVIGIALLTDPFSDLKGVNDLIGCTLAVLSAVLFNLGFIALRKVKSQLNSWQIVFYFTVTNMLMSPFCFLADNSLAENPSYYDFEPNSFLLIILIGVLTVVGSFCVNKTLMYEKAGRATAYYNMELIYTFLFDIFISKA
jgi:drug/metabolite transporter (DMT)-like permease